MITIVEGPDCSGKTTLIKNAIDTNYLRHFSAPTGPDNAWEQYLAALVDCAATIEKWNDELEMERTDGKRPSHWNLVFDRFIYGELVYPQAMGRASNFTRVHARMLERIVHSMQPVMVMCRTSYDTSKELWQDRKGSEMIQDDAKFRAAYDGWGKLFADHFPSIPTVFYDMTRDQYPDIIKQIEKKRPQPNQGPGIGSFKPWNILMVGEQVNPNVDTNDWPFVDYAKHGASYWLTNLLDNFGLGEDQLYWINALTRDGRETNAEFIERLQPRLVITMGKTAEIWADRNIKHIKSPITRLKHPAYHKRFHSGVVYPLITKLHHDRELQQAPKDGI